MNNVYADRFCLLRVIVSLSESLPELESSVILERYKAAIQVVGTAHLGLVWNNLVIWMLSDREIGVIRYCPELAEREVIEKVADLYKKSMMGELIEIDNCKLLQEELRRKLKKQFKEEMDRRDKNYALSKALVASILAADILHSPFKQDSEEEEQGEFGGIHAVFVQTSIEAAWEWGKQPAATQVAIAIKDKLFSLLWDLQIPNAIARDDRLA